VSRPRPSNTARRRVGRVSYYLHHGAWHVYYRDGRQQVRCRVADNEQDAARISAQINAQLAAATPTLLAFEPVGVAELRRRFLDDHEQVRRSSLATVARYRAATKHLEDYAATLPASAMAHQLSPRAFVAYLRGLLVAPNGHPNSRRRALRDKGIRYILECCRAMYASAARMRHLPPYATNPFADLGIDRMRVEDAKPVVVFDAAAELAFLRAADDWAFPLHLTLAKTGLRPGELAHLLIEDLDLEGGWLRVRGKPELGWRVKTGRDRDVPLADELIAALRRAIGARAAGPVFLKPSFAGDTRPRVTSGRSGMAALVRRRLDDAATTGGGVPSRIVAAGVARGVWRDAGAVDPDRIRSSFARIASSIGRPDATCPKSWRHGFATLMQDANVDPLIRQVVLGHQPTDPCSGALGMTSVYTHSRPVTIRREVLRALALWPESLGLARHWSLAQPAT
jgi:integrase